MKKGFGLAGFGILIVIIVLAIAVAQTSFVPFHARLQRIQQIFSPDGALESEQIIIESYTRNSRGDTYIEGSILNSLTGQTEGSIKTIQNANEKRIYLIDEGKKTAVITSTPFAAKQFKPPLGGERSTYLGRTCAVFRPQDGGELFVDIELGHPLYQRREVPLEGGRNMVRVSRVTDLTVNQEADDSLFAPPSLEGYKIVGSTAK